MPIPQKSCCSFTPMTFALSVFLMPLMESCATTSAPASSHQPALQISGVPAKPSPPHIPLLLLTEEEALLDKQRIGDVEDLEVLRDAMRGGPPSALNAPLARRAHEDQRARKGKAHLTLCLTSKVNTEMIWGALYTAMKEGFEQITLAAAQAPGYGAACEPLGLSSGHSEGAKQPLSLVFVGRRETLVVLGEKRVEGPAKGRLAWITRQLAAHPRTGRVHIIGEDRPFGEVVAMVRHLSELGFSRLHLADGQGTTFPHDGPETQSLKVLNEDEGDSLSTVFGPGQQIGEEYGLGGLGRNDPDDPGTIGLGTLGTHRDKPPRQGRIRLGRPEVQGGIAVELVARMTARLRGQIKSCYQRRLKKRSKLAGHLRVDYTIDPRGRVSQVSISEDKVKDAPLAACVKAAFNRRRFPRPGDHQPVKVSQTVTFASRK